MITKWFSYWNARYVCVEPANRSALLYQVKQALYPSTAQCFSRNISFYVYIKLSLQVHILIKCFVVLWRTQTACAHNNLKCFHGNKRTCSISSLNRKKISIYLVPKPHITLLWCSLADIVKYAHMYAVKMNLCMFWSTIA